MNSIVAMEWALGCAAMDIVAFSVGSVYNVDIEFFYAHPMLCMLTCVLVHFCVCALWLAIYLQCHELGLLASSQGLKSPCVQGSGFCIDSGFWSNSIGFGA